MAQRQAKSAEIDNCISKFDGAIDSTKISLQALEVGDYTTMRTYIINAQTNYIVCNNGFRNTFTTNPIAKSTKFLEDMAIVGKYLVTLIK